MDGLRLLLLLKLLLMLVKLLLLLVVFLLTAGDARQHHSREHAELSRGGGYCTHADVNRRCHRTDLDDCGTLTERMR